ncbi:hypothetical protein ACSMXN_07885 [Jatrophihabitans sp. DSM 45814]
MFELLVSGDAVVPDHDAALRQCQQEWLLPDQRPQWTVESPALGAKWTFARVQADRRAAPTALEVLGVPFKAPAPAERGVGYAFIPEIAAAQGTRPSRTHSTVLSTTDLDAVAARLAAAGAKFRLDQPDGIFPFPRLWVGFSPSGGELYDPSADAGLHLEVIPHEPLLMPALDAEFVPPLPARGLPVNVVARTIVLPDVNAALHTLDANLGWRPSSDATAPDGTRRARFAFPYPRSAALELVEPAFGSAEADFLDQWGPGPFSSRIAVRDLDALEERLAVAGIRCTYLPAAQPGEPKRLLRPAEWRLGTALEFVESADT